MAVGFGAFFLEDYGDVVPNRKSESIALADQFLLGPPVDQRPLAERAHEDVEQTRVHRNLFGD